MSIYWKNWMTKETQGEIPDGSRVIVNDEIEVSVDNHGDIRISTKDHGRLVLIPQASNVVIASREIDSLDRYRELLDAFGTDPQHEDVAAKLTGMPLHLRVRLGGRSDLETDDLRRERKRRERSQARQKD